MAENISFQFPQLYPEVMDANVYTATITDIDYDNDKADITINDIGSFSNVEIFYHCQHCSNTTGGSRAFNIDDSVRVLNPKGSCTPSVSDPFSKMRIVGFADGSPRSCSTIFYFTLIRGDYEEITEDSGLLGSFTTKNSNGDVVSNSTLWDVDTTSWKVVIGGVDHDPNGFWVSYDCTYGASTQYPYKYKTVDKANTLDLIKSGEYTDTIPYWRVVNTGASGSLHDIGGVNSTSISVYSSIPYEITHNVTAPENNPCYIVYSVRGVTGLAGDGERCCQLLSQGWCADVNGPDPAVRMPGGASVWANGGFGNSFMILDIKSSLVTYQEKAPTRLTAINIQETEVLGAEISGRSRSMTITNNTSTDALVVVWECSPLCPYSINDWARYEYLQNRIGISFSADYDF